jgi:hypothetical protein
MNARFRAGFCTSLDQLPWLRRLLPFAARHRRTNTSSVTGIALAGKADYVTYGLLGTFSLWRIKLSILQILLRDESEYLENYAY